MRKLLLLFAIFSATQVFAASGPITITFQNFTTPGNVFLGIAEGPSVNSDGNTVQFTTTLNGIQTIGLGFSGNLCYSGTTAVVLNAALWKGDPISIIYIQPQQIPVGVNCACYGTACSSA